MKIKEVLFLHKNLDPFQFDESLQPTLKVAKVLVDQKVESLQTLLTEASAVQEVAEIALPSFLPKLPPVGSGNFTPIQVKILKLLK